MVPTSLLAYMTLMRTVSGRMARQCRRVHAPVGIYRHERHVAAELPVELFHRCADGVMFNGVVMMWPRPVYAMPRMARLSLSVPQLVNTTSVG